MNTNTTIKNPLNVNKTSKLAFINCVNTYVEKEKENSIGISLFYIMVGSGIASITAALAVEGDVSMPILITAAVLSMGTNVCVLGQLPFKISTWSFIVSVIVNVFLLVYQIA
ncbi:hypothetical protein [Polaribacter sp. HL-MS24]|uniref:hypothetical protein n=1 Tax=Polaribacter sp. HL-MS24 TaxID=3077735 RepID=UPI0029351435|nr:hypothetical protein [Polaribacter sp. HL-MS24]WOC40359.1 hypothetical protein RRF69_00665 [Polaribacter sp. HL-MS24]